METFILTFLLLSATALSSNAQNTTMKTTRSAENTVREFLETVRSGKSPERASEFMADSVKAHQLNAENPEIVKDLILNFPVGALVESDGEDNGNDCDQEC